MKTDVLLANVQTNKGNNINTLSGTHTVMLVFLRHFGCIFCREALRDVSDRLPVFKKQNIHPIFVHMADVQTAETYFTEYNIPDPEHISDPECLLYKKFNLAKANFNQLFGLKTWIRGFEASRSGIPFKKQQVGDGFQMPGIFLINQEEICGKFIHKKSSDRPDYDKLIECCNVS